MLITVLIILLSLIASVSTLLINWKASYNISHEKDTFHFDLNIIKKKKVKKSNPVAIDEDSNVTELEPLSTDSPTRFKTTTSKISPT